MADISLIRTEMRDVEDRDILLQLLAYQREQNGRQADLMADYYGDEERSIRGTKPQAEENTLLIAEAKTVVRVIWGLVTVLGGGTVVALLRAF